MILFLDTNTILRFLTKDIPKQADVVEKRLKDCQRGDITLEITSLIVAEVLYHLVRWYGFSREDAAEKIIVFLSPEWISLEEKSVVVSALRKFQETRIDFADLLLWAKASIENKKILSFDLDFDKLSPKVREEP